MTQLPSTHLAAASFPTLLGCRAVLDAAEAQALQQATPMSIGIVDAGGSLRLFVRMDGVHLGTVDVALAKARCAVQFARPTRVFAEALAGGATGLVALPGMVPFAGGIPLIIDGRVVGAIGASGASPDLDERVAIAGAQALQSSIGGDPT